MTTIRLHARTSSVTTLGPGPAAAVWTQGCPIGCTGCMSKPTWDGGGGELVDVDDLARWLDGTGHSYLTISGGEPFEQPGPLAELIDTIRAKRDWVVTCYSGYRLERLRAGQPPGASELLTRLDALIDGPYRADQHAPLLWRGSRNQRIHLLTDRLVLPADEPAGIQVEVTRDGTAIIVGVPPDAEFVARLESALRTRTGRT